MSSARSRKPLSHRRKATPQVLGPTLRATPGWSNEVKENPVGLRIHDLKTVQGSDFVNETENVGGDTWSVGLKPLSNIEHNSPSQGETSRDLEGGNSELRDKPIEKTDIEVFTTRSNDSEQKELDSGNVALREQLAGLQKGNEKLRNVVQTLESIIDIQGKREEDLEKKVQDLEAIIRDVVSSKLKLADETSKAMSELRLRLTRCEVCNAELESNPSEGGVSFFRKRQK